MLSAYEVTTVTMIYLIGVFVFAVVVLMDISIRAIFCTRSVAIGKAGYTSGFL